MEVDFNGVSGRDVGVTEISDCRGSCGVEALSSSNASPSMATSGIVETSSFGTSAGICSAASSEDFESSLTVDDGASEVRESTLVREVSARLGDAVREGISEDGLLDRCSFTALARRSWRRSFALFPVREGVRLRAMRLSAQRARQTGHGGLPCS